MDQWINRCHFGDVRAVLRKMIEAGVQVDCIVTSPPYWALRSYLPAGHADKVHEIGSEPTVHDWVRTMVEVFDLCRQVLRDDGTMWLNFGDNYAANRGAGGASSGDVGQRAGQLRAATGGLKPKDMVGQPWRAAFALQDAGWWLRQDIIWSKPSPMPESVRDRCTKAHEYIFLLAKAETYYYDFEAMQEPVNGGAHARRSKAELSGLKRPGFGHGFDAAAKPRYKTPDGWATGPGAHEAIAHNVPERRGPKDVDGASARMGRGAGWRKLADEGSGIKSNDSMDAALAEVRNTRNRRSVWTIASEPYSGAHFATFPRALVEPCILAGCRPGGIVLDPFFGSGTTGQVAQQLGRQFIGIDLNDANAPLQADRLRQPSLNLEAA